MNAAAIARSRVHRWNRALVPIEVYGSPTPAAGDEEDDPESMERLLERTHAITVDEHREFGAGNLQLF